MTLVRTRRTGGPVGRSWKPLFPEYRGHASGSGRERRSDQRRRAV